MKTEERKGMRGSVGALAAIALAAWATTCPAAVQPLLEFRFNESGSIVTNTGSVGGTAALIKSDGSTNDLHSAGGTGPSGGYLDAAFDNTDATGMGIFGTGGGAVLGASFGSNYFSSLTIAGWMNKASGLSGDARIYVDDKIDLYWTSQGALRLPVGGVNATSTSGTYNAATNTWTFFAVTFDNASGEVNFYRGFTNAAPTLINTATVPIGALLTNRSTFTIGNGAFPYNRAFDGWLDNVRLHGSTSGSSGALSQTQLQDWWSMDLVAPVPEPAVAALGALGASLLLVGWRHSRAPSSRP